MNRLAPTSAPVANDPKRSSALAIVFTALQPFARNPLEGVTTAVTEAQTGARHEVFDCARYKTFARAGKRFHPRGYAALAPCLVALEEGR